MNKHVHRAAIALLAVLAVLGPPGAGADDEANVVDAVSNGDAGLLFRYRYEFVDEQGFDDNANASTLLTRLNYETGSWRDWSGFLEFDYVAELLIKDYNSGAGTSGPNRDRYPVVADPGGPDLNQLYLQYAPSDALRTRIGRQRFNLDDQRYVGGVGWRQNEQTYDALSVTYDGWEATSVFYSYVVNVARIYGNTVPAGNHEQSTHLLNARMDLNQDFKIIGYAYLIDNDDEPAFSTQTFGVRAEGSIALDEGKLALLGEAATQSDYGNQPANFDTGYFRLQALWTGGAFTVGAGMESLGSDNGQGFRTPLATLHAFNGWADRFLATPADGLDDLYIRFGYKLDTWNLQATWHDFDSEVGGTSYGSELDLLATRTLGGRYDLMLKFAAFDSDDPAFNDATKAWVMVTTEF